LLVKKLNHILGTWAAPLLEVGYTSPPLFKSEGFRGYKLQQRGYTSSSSSSSSIYLPYFHINLQPHIMQWQATRKTQSST